MRRDKRNNPVWDMPAEVPVTRQDNSMSMTMEAATITDQETGAVVAEINYAIGRLAFVVWMKDEKTGNTTGRYLLDIGPFIKNFAAATATDPLRAERLAPPKGAS